MTTKFLLLALLLAQSAEAAVLDYPISKKTLPNGLDVIVIETPEFKDVLSFNTMILAGSGKEQEKGKTGLAHLFEHILFRHRFAGEEGGYDDRMSKLGTHNNAWTWFDITYYHPLTFTANLERKPAKADDLPGLLDLEAARFTKLDFSEKTFRTEAGAVLGEYRRGASQPSERMEETLFALMYPEHPYGHTTIGFYEDIVNMPEGFEAAKRFYETYYRPNNTVIVVAGDVKAQAVFPKIEQRYKAWEKRPIPAVESKPPAARAELRRHVPWDADVAPLVWVAYRMPAFNPGAKESAAAQVLAELLVSQAAPLYKKLRYDKQTVSGLGFQEGTQGFESFDPRLLTIGAQLYKEQLAAKGPGYFDGVVADVIAGVDELKSFSKQKGAADLLRTVKDRYRYDFLAGLSSPERIASTFSWYYRFNRDVDALEKLLASVQNLRPEDVDAFANKYFKPENRAVLTLAYQPAKKGN